MNVKLLTPPPMGGGTANNNKNIFTGAETGNQKAHKEMAQAGVGGRCDVNEHRVISQVPAETVQGISMENMEELADLKSKGGSRGGGTARTTGTGRGVKKSVVFSAKDRRRAAYRPNRKDHHKSLVLCGPPHRRASAPVHLVQAYKKGKKCDLVTSISTRSKKRTYAHG